jgi:hypothetical protein
MELTKNKSEDIIIYHYPVRNINQFIKKIKNAGSAYEINKRLDKSIGFHTRRWYEDYKNNRIEDTYGNMILKEEDVVKLKKKNVIQKLIFEDMFT